MFNPFVNPAIQRDTLSEEAVSRQATDRPGPALAVVVAVVDTLSAGQRIRWKEQTGDTLTGGAVVAPNPEEGTALVPAAVGSVAVGDLVTVFPLPALDEWLGLPSSGTGPGVGGDGWIAGVVLADLGGSPRAYSVREVWVLADGTTIVTPVNRFQGWAGYSLSGTLAATDRVMGRFSPSVDDPGQLRLGLMPAGNGTGVLQTKTFKKWRYACVAGSLQETEYTVTVTGRDLEITES